jgi:DNA-binding LacI/PurR family transcriptional regulator
MQSLLSKISIKLLVTDVPTAGWYEEAAKDRILDLLERNSNGTPHLIICGNDTLALGAVKAIQEFSLRVKKPLCQYNNDYPLVFGYDGQPLAISAIAEPCSPFRATIKTPLDDCGKTIAEIIERDLKDHENSSTKLNEELVRTIQHGFQGGPNLW